MKMQEDTCNNSSRKIQIKEKNSLNQKNKK